MFEKYWVKVSLRILRDYIDPNNRLLLAVRLIRDEATVQEDSNGTSHHGYGHLSYPHE